MVGQQRLDLEDVEAGPVEGGGVNIQPLLGRLPTRGDEKKLDALSKSEFDALVGEALAYDEVLRKSGHYIVSNALQSVQTATTVRIWNGTVSTTDGPFAETKEQLGGFMLIDARDY